MIVWSSATKNTARHRARMIAARTKPVGYIISSSSSVVSSATSVDPFSFSSTVLLMGSVESEEDSNLASGVGCSASERGVSLGSDIDGER